MDLDKVAAQVRARNYWEAVDLGCLMARQWWRPLMQAWLLITLPLFVFLHLIFLQDPYWVLVCFWWLKPVYDRVLLHVASRAFFGESLGLKQILKNLWSIVSPGLFGALTWYRLDPVRSLNLPVWQLEGLRGRERRQRANLLQRNAYSAAMGLSFVCANLEMILFLGMYSLIYMFLPDEVDLSLLDLVRGEWGDAYVWASIGYYIAIGLVGPFFVCGGFALYLNRRTILEAWDIELTFRRMVQRITQVGKKLLATLLIAAVVNVSIPTHAHAESTTDESAVSDSPTDKSQSEKEAENEQKTNKFCAQWAEIRARPGDTNVDQALREVFSSREFDVCTTKTSRELDFDWKSDPKENKDMGWLSGFMQLLASSVEAILWIALALLIIFIVVRVAKVRVQAPGFSRSDTDEAPHEMFGLDIRPQSLPDDIPAAARKLAEEGNIAAALSLLYRGVLSHLVHVNRVVIKVSDTEGDCQRKASRYLNGQLADLVVQVTQLWVRAAYSSVMPDKRDVHAVCDQWVSTMAEKGA